MIVENYTLQIEAQPQCDVVDITRQVAGRVKESGISSGLVTVFNVGSTAGVTTVEYEPGCVKDLSDLFDRLAPPTRDYHHEQAWHDGNGYSHMRATLLKPGLSIPVSDGAMRLGTWQQIVLVNFDNRARRRSVAVQVMGL